MQRIVIYGTGGFGRELVRPAQAAALRLEPETASVCFFDDRKSSEQIVGLPIIGSIQPQDYVVLAIGSGAVRQQLEQKIHAIGANCLTLIAPTAIVGPDVVIGNGAVLCDFAMITASARIGRQFQANIYSYVAHDCIIGDYVTLAPKAAVNGNVHIGDGAYIGTGAVIKQGTPDKPLVIGAGAVVGMGAVVTRDVAPGDVVVGNPARPRQ